MLGSPLASTVIAEANKEKDDEDELETPKMTLWTTIFLLVVVTVVS